jgi:UDP-GlcNAc3NAcA epimerase
MLDAARYYSSQAAKKAKIFKESPAHDFALVTIHRQENTDDAGKLRSIFNALEEINQQVKIIMPLHPRTQKKLEEYSIKTSIRIIEPVGYFDMIQLLKACKLVLTDSGGLQKEAFFFKKSCVTLREETEWVELIENGVNVLAGSNSENILAASSKMLSQKLDFDIDLYGDGNTGMQILKELQEFS